MNDFFQLDTDAQAQRMAELATSALPQWNLQRAELSLIKYRENAVFEVSLPDGQRFALRIHRHGYHTDDELRSELLWMHALQQVGIHVPSLVPTRDGALFFTASHDGIPGEHQIDVFEWIDGHQLGSVESGLGENTNRADCYQTLGELAARIHNQAVNWPLPDGFQRHAWDLEGLVGDAPFWGPFWELEALTDPQRDLLLSARAKVRDQMTRYAALPESANRYSMIHADFVAENVMVHEGDVRLIDFDDAGFGWHLFELATAVYFEYREDHYPEIWDALVAGYRRHRDLPDEQLAYMPTFLMARSFTYLGWVHTRSETETARELTPMLIELCCGIAEEYLEAETLN